MVAFGRDIVLESPFGALIESPFGVRMAGGDDGGYMMGGDLELYHYEAWDAGAPEYQWNVAPYAHYKTTRNDRYDHADDSWSSRADLLDAVCSGLWHTGPGPPNEGWYGNNKAFVALDGIHITHGVRVGMYTGLEYSHTPPPPNPPPWPPDDLPIPWSYADWPAGYEAVDELNKMPWYNFANTNMRYDPDSWSVRTPDPSADYLIGTAVFAVGDVGYMCGGRHPDNFVAADPNPEGLPPDEWWLYEYTKGPYTNAVRTYAARTDTWAAGAAMPIAARGNMCATSYAGIGYVTGGRDEEQAGTGYAETFSFDPVTEAWTQKVDTRLPNYARTFQTLGSFGYVLGAGSQVHRLTFETGAWEMALGLLPNGMTTTSDCASWSTPNHIVYAGVVSHTYTPNATLLFDGDVTVGGTPVSHGADYPGPGLRRAVLGASLS